MDSLQERLRKEIGGWEQAYPLSAFPEPDLKRAAAVLKEAGMTLGAISASNMRHVVSRLAPSIHEAADALDAAEARIAEAREQALEEAALLCEGFNAATAVMGARIRALKAEDAG